MNKRIQLSLSVMLILILLFSISNVAYALSINAPAELPDAKLGQPYSYTFSINDGTFFSLNIYDANSESDYPAASFFQGSVGGGYRFPDFSFDVATGKFSGTPSLDYDFEGKYIIELCGLDAAKDNNYVCKNVSTWHILSDVVTTKGTGDLQASLVWRPTEGYADDQFNRLSLNIMYGFLGCGTDRAIKSQDAYSQDDIARYASLRVGNSVERRLREFEFSSAPLSIEESLSGSICAQRVTGSSSASIDGTKLTFKTSGSYSYSASGTYALTSAQGDITISGHLSPMLIITNTGTENRLVDITLSGSVSSPIPGVGAMSLGAKGGISGGIYSTSGRIEVEDFERYAKLDQEGKITTEEYSDKTSLYLAVGTGYYGEGEKLSDTKSKRFVIFPGRSVSIFSVDSTVSEGSAGESDSYAGEASGSLEITIAPVECPDEIPPTTSATAIDDKGDSYEFGDAVASSYVKVNFSCSDDAKCTPSGCSPTHYCVDQTNTCTPDKLYATEGPAQLTSGGISYVRYRSADKAGNSEDVKSAIVNLTKQGAGPSPIVKPEEPKPQQTPPSIVVQNGVLVPPTSRLVLTSVTQRKTDSVIVSVFGWSKWRAVNTTSCFRGSSCASSSDCCGAECVEGACLCGMSACSASGECCSGYCEEGQCRTPPTMSSLLFSKTLRGCAGLIDECLPGEGSCVAICNGLTILLLITAVGAGFVAWRRFNHPVTAIVAAVIPIFVGILLYTFVGIISALVIIAMLVYLKTGVKPIPVSAGELTSMQRIQPTQPTKPAQPLRREKEAKKTPKK